MRRLELILVGLAAALPAWSVSMTATPPPQPIPPNLNRDSLAPAPIENWTTGSGALLPLVATDTQATRIHAVDEPTGAAGAKVAAVDDATFVSKASASGQKEVAAARDAIPKLGNPRLKSMAEMLVQDHTRANATLSKLAEAKGWPMADKPGAAPPMAGEAAGADFDRQWTAEMIAGHERSVAMYRAQAQSGDDKDLRQFAHDTLPTIEHHLAELRKLQK
jgi:putative membrane protein